jgi:hypothetical protein
MEDRETPRMRKYGESKTTQIMMATVPHLTAWAERMKYHADGFLFDRVYMGDIKANKEYIKFRTQHKQH